MNDYVWENILVTQEEAQALIDYHGKAAQQLQNRSKKHLDRAAEIKRLTTAVTYAVSGAQKG